MMFLLRIIKVILIFLSTCVSLNSETLELEDTSLHGKKDQPEAITFVTVAKTRSSYLEKEVDYLNKIIEEVKSSNFDIINSRNN